MKVGTFESSVKIANSWYIIIPNMNKVSNNCFFFDRKNEKVKNLHV